MADQRRDEGEENKDAAPRMRTRRWTRALSKADAQGFRDRRHQRDQTGWSKVQVQPQFSEDLSVGGRLRLLAAANQCRHSTVLLSCREISQGFCQGFCHGQPILFQFMAPLAAPTPARREDQRGKDSWLQLVPSCAEASFVEENSIDTRMRVSAVVLLHPLLLRCGFSTSRSSNRQAFPFKSPACKVH
jgi:hypothetical protein